MKLRFSAFLCGVLMVVVGVTTSTPANAATAFDDLIQVTTTLELKSPNGMHIEQYVEYTYLDLMAQQCPSEYSQFVEDSQDPDFHAAVFQYSTPYAGTTPAMVWSTVSGATTTFRGAEEGYLGSENIAIEPVNNSMSLAMDDSGNIECYGYTDGTTIAQMLGMRGFTSDYLKVLFSSYPVVYPSGYAGGVVPVAPPAVSTLPVTGTIDCGGEDPGYMTIYQAGNIGAAVLTPLSLGRAEWHYDLSHDAPYSFNISCGNSIAAGFRPAFVSEGTDWICDTVSTEPYRCVLS